MILINVIYYLQHRTHPIVQVIEGMYVLENLQHLTLTKTFMKVFIANSSQCHLCICSHQQVSERIAKLWRCLDLNTQRCLFDKQFRGEALKNIFCDTTVDFMALFEAAEISLNQEYSDITNKRNILHGYMHYVSIKIKFSKCI